MEGWKDILWPFLRWWTWSQWQDVLLVDTTFALLWRAADFFDEQVPWG